MKVPDIDAEIRKAIAGTIATARAEARNQALEEAAKLAETPGVWKPHPEIPDCFRISTAIRALIERESKEG